MFEDKLKHTAATCRVVSWSFQRSRWKGSGPLLANLSVEFNLNGVAHCVLKPIVHPK